MLYAFAFLFLGMLCVGYGITAGNKLKKKYPWLLDNAPGLAKQVGIFFILVSIYIFLLALHIVQ